MPHLIDKFKISGGYLYGIWHVKLILVNMNAFCPRRSTVLHFNRNRTFFCLNNKINMRLRVGFPKKGR